MYSEDLQQQRTAKWRTDGQHPVRTIDDARAFIDSMGFALIYPTRPAVTAPTFIGAVLGTNEDLPIASKAAVDPRTQLSSELVLRLLHEKFAFEVPFGESGSLLVSAAEFPYFYALLGERNPKSLPSEGVRGEKTLAAHTFKLLAKQPMTEQEMLVAHGKGISESALARALHELWSKLRTVRVDLLDRTAESPKWDVLYRVAPTQVNRGAHLSQAEALSALISKYLETVIAIEAREIEEFFGQITSRSKVAEVVKALTAAREFESTVVGHTSMVRLVSREPQPELGSTQQRALQRERRTATDIGKGMILRHDKRNPQREDRRQGKWPPRERKPERKPTH
jgi:23S rRNA pseudouridine2605 synthase